MLLVVAIVPFVSSTVLPHINAVAVHHSILERALEVSAVGPLKASIAAHLVLTPHASVLRSIGPEVAPFALFDALSENSVVVAAIGPDFDSLPIALVLFLLHIPVLDRLGYVTPQVLAEYV